MLAALLLAVSRLGVLEYYKRGEVNIPYAAIAAAGRFLGTFAGGLIVVAARLLLTTR